MKYGIQDDPSFQQMQILIKYVPIKQHVHVHSSEECRGLPWCIQKWKK